MIHVTLFQHHVELAYLDTPFDLSKQMWRNSLREKKSGKISYSKSQIKHLLTEPTFNATHSVKLP